MIEDADKEDEEAKANAKAENEELENAANKALGGNENGNTEKLKEKEND